MGLNRYKKSRLWLGGSLRYPGVLFHSHRCHPNRKLILNNKDHNKDDDNNRESLVWVHVLNISLDYRPNRDFVKGFGWNSGNGIILISEALHETFIAFYHRFLSTLLMWRG